MRRLAGDTELFKLLALARIQTGSDPPFGDQERVSLNAASGRRIMSTTPSTLEISEGPESPGSGRGLRLVGGPVIFRASMPYLAA